MTLEENIKAILECNFSIAREEVIESAKTRIMEQISRQNPLEELEQIKEEIQDLDLGFVDEEYQAGIAYGIMKFNQILNKHIKENKQ